MKEVIDSILSHGVQAYRSKALQTTMEMRGKIDSPIEIALLLAMVARCISEDGVKPAFKETKDALGWVILSQVQIEKYRVDFVVSLKPLRQKIVVECDGHDFHERTKEQAARDRSRDRSLTEDGYRVVRFTGSEIWRDPWGCAQEVSNQFVSIMHQEWDSNGQD